MFKRREKDLEKWHSFFKDSTSGRTLAASKLQLVLFLHGANNHDDLAMVHAVLINRLFARFNTAFVIFKAVEEIRSFG